MFRGTHLSVEVFILRFVQVRVYGQWFEYPSLLCEIIGEVDGLRFELVHIVFFASYGGH
jgi:hypothetical protein